ncbi:hypothetical protein F9Y85_19885 [Pseudoalteromonas maricaloris]|uniref:Uncharacterized protein n=1 Tax=Pseudoalteromonas maricaloris TaxID=184924 RepID=A0A8I2H9E3_9GAMM|nr:hypothetical protein [Pseudoalteromonas maricaloris]
MVYKIIGGVAIFLSIVALYPSMQPGAPSVIGFYLTLLSMFISALASQRQLPYYFYCVALFSLSNVLFLNDGTRLSLLFIQGDWTYICSMYSLFLVVLCIGSLLIRYKTRSSQ